MCKVLTPWGLCTCPNIWVVWWCISVYKRAKISHFGWSNFDFLQSKRGIVSSYLATSPLATSHSTKHTTTNMSCHCPTSQWLCLLLPWVGQQSPHCMVPRPPMVPCQVPMVWFGSATIGCHVWGVRHNKHQQIERKWWLGLSGRNLNPGRHNNQPKVDVQGRRDIGEVVRGGWSVWGDVTSLFGRGLGRQKIIDNKSRRGLSKPPISE
jgi:hypothetical protein